MSETEAAPPAAQAPLPDIRAELSRIRSAQPDAVLDVEERPQRDMFWITIRPRSLVQVCRLLRDDRSLDYKLICDVTCVDRPYEQKRFTVTYNLYSVSR